MASDPAGALGEWQIRQPIAVAIPDHTRPIDPRQALTALNDRLIGGMTVVVGRGLHREMNSHERERLSGWSVVEHDPDDVVATAQVDGIPGFVGRPIAEAAWSISVGVAELHQFAGVSGGHKGVAVGCGGRATLAALHHRDRSMAEGVEVGRIFGNPFRYVVDALGEAARCRLALVWVPSANCWLAGDPRKVVVAALQLLDPWWWVSTPAKGAVLRVPASKSGSLYQASRAATYLALSPKPPIAPGGVLILEASCTEGLGTEAGFVSALTSCSPPWSRLLTGLPPLGAGAQRAVMLARLSERYKLRVEGCVAPIELRRAGISAVEQTSTLAPDWLDIPEPFNRLPQLRT